MPLGRKQAILAEFAAVARALGHGHRLEILGHLGQGERSVDGLAAPVGLSVANAAQHLQMLRRAGLVSSRRDGKFVLYTLAEGAVVTLLCALRTVAKHNLAEVGQIRRCYFGARDSLEPI